MSKKRDILFQIELSEEKNIEIPEESKNEAGETVIVQKKSKKVELSKYGFFKPARALREDAEFYKAAQFGKAIDSGLTTVTLLEKKYLNNGGVFTADETTKRKSLYKELLDLNLKVRDEKVEETKKSLESKRAEIIDQILEIEQKVRPLYENTAEAVSRSRTILFFAINSAAKLNSETKIFEDLFTGDLEDKFDQLDELESKQSLDSLGFSYIWGIAGLWYDNNKLTQKELNSMLDIPKDPISFNSEDSK